MKQPEAQVAAIGLAGENRVYYSTVEHSNSSASRGVGVIMGDKRLKAIAVRGTKDVNVARPAELFELCNAQYKEIYDNPNCGCVFRHEDDESWHVDNFAWGNARDRVRGVWTEEREKEWEATTRKYEVRWTGCYNCPKDCHVAIRYPGRQTFQLKCYSKLTYAMAAYEELDFNYKMLSYTQEYGLDGFTTPQLLAFAVELYEAGILTDEDVPDFPPDTANRFFYLVEKIVHREGIGDKLANGVYWAARQIGKGAEAYDHNTMKKFEQVPIKLGTVNYPYFLMYATGEKMNITQIEGSYPQIPIADKEEREAFVAGWEAAPSGSRSGTWSGSRARTPPSRRRSTSPTGTRPCTTSTTPSAPAPSCRRSAASSAAVRRTTSTTCPGSSTHATGFDLDDASLWEIARRNRNLIRASTSAAACGASTRRRPPTTGRSGSPRTSRSSSTRTTSSRGGPTTASRPRRRWTPWAWGT